MSDYKESYQNEQMFEKPRGERRWLGKEHHRGKERLHNAVKDRTFIEKTVSSTEPLSKKASQKISDSTNDGLKLDVVYSLYKKNRHRDADVIKLLQGTPEDLKAEVVEKNALEQFGFLYKSKSTYAVHSKLVSPAEAPGEFEIRSVQSSGRGQEYSNFLPSSREMSKKGNASRADDEEEDERVDSQPTVSYNIYRTHRSRDAVGSQMFKAQTISKSKKHRANKKIDIDLFDDEDDFEDEQDDLVDSDFIRKSHSSLNLTECLVEHKNKNTKKRPEGPTVVDGPLEKVCIDSGTSFPEELDIQRVLHNEGYTFINADVVFLNFKDNFEQQMKALALEKDLRIKDLRPQQYLIDASNWCQLDGSQDGETTMVIVFTLLKKNHFNVLVNSTIASNPSQWGSQFLQSLIARAKTVREAVSLITSKFLTNRQTINTMKLSSEFYGKKTLPEMLHDSYEWENQLCDMPWTNKYNFATWANSEELTTVGAKIEWENVCAMVRKERQLGTCYTSGEKCGMCYQKKKSHELFLVENESKVKCTECLRNEFYRELRARRVPIDLQTETADELEYLPAFVPLTVLNLYIRIVSEMIYKDIGASGSFEKCPSCKSAVYFERNSKLTHSCSCGYSWCSQCESAPHWPMKCSEYAEWSTKWLLRYSWMRAQGDGSEMMLRITCSCKKCIYSVRLPVEYMECPGCKLYVNKSRMSTEWKKVYIPWEAPVRKYIANGFNYNLHTQPPYNHRDKTYLPIDKEYFEVSEIAEINSKVSAVCGAARDVRYDVNFRNRAVSKEHALIRKNILETREVENLFGTVVYLTENVTAWMHVTNQYDRNVKNTLKSMMEGRTELMQLLGGEDREAIHECIRKIRTQIDSVVSAVEHKLQNPKSL